mmetsp:Transcript_7753/g.9642  ORF Transcript_7753/g.9642 Transcript_7753/m.9642 type:complete len:146 (-) Transcript_7753:62-499(-)
MASTVLQTVSLLLLVVASSAHEAAKPVSRVVVIEPNETTSIFSRAWSNIIYCKCGVTCAKQLGDMYLFHLGQSCACNEASSCEASNLRGSDTPKVQKVESTEKKVSLKSLQWEGASAKNLLYCKCGRKCLDGPVGACNRYGCQHC